MEILGGTGRDGIFLGKILGGTGRLVFFSRRDGAVVVFFSRRDGAVVFFSRSGTGRLFFFSEAGRGGCIFFPRQDGAVVFFFRGGTGRGGCVFSAPGPGCCIFCSRRDGRGFFSTGTGRLTVVVFSAGTVLFIRVPSGGGHIFFKVSWWCMIWPRQFCRLETMRMAHVNCKFLHLAFKIVSSAIIFIFSLERSSIRIIGCFNHRL